MRRSRRICLRFLFARCTLSPPFVCERCGATRPHYYRAVFAFGVAPADACYECVIERRPDFVGPRMPGKPSIDGIVADLSAGHSQREVAALWGVSARTVRRIIAESVAQLSSR